MKAIKNLVMLSALAGAMSLVSCSNDEEESVNNGAVRFTAGIGKEAVVSGTETRASGTAWGSGDHIGIFMVNHGATTIAEGAANKQYTTAHGDGGFTPIMGDEIYYPMDGAAVDFIAYYPYAGTATLDDLLSVEIGTVQTTASQAGFDLLWAKANNSGNGYNKEHPGTVAFTFGHCLSKLTMNCKVHASVGASMPDDATVTIKGMNTRNTFDLKTGAPGATPDTPADISPNKAPGIAGFHAAYDAIIMPCSYAAGAVTVEFEISGEVFTWEVEAIDFKAGSEYIYEVNITRTGVQVQGTINPWNPVERGPVTAE